MNRCVRATVAAVLLMTPTTLVGQAATPSAAGDTTERIDRTSRVTGRVRDANGRAAPHVRVSVIGLGRETRTTLHGHFRFDSLPAATFTLEAVQIGSIPGRVVVELSPGDSTSADITLGAGIVILETAVVTEQWATEIERRARISTSGYFIKPAEVAARGRNTPLGALLYQVPSVKASCLPASSCGVLMRAPATGFTSRYCEPSLYIDGVRDRFAGWSSVYSGDIVAVEIYRQVSRPFEFVDENACGAVAVWTKPLEPRTRKLTPH